MRCAHLPHGIRTTRWVYAAPKKDRTARSAKAFLKAVIQAAPFRLQKILTDNGPEFTNHFLVKTRQPTGTHAFDPVYAEQSIEHRLMPPRRPQTHGMVERINGRIEDVLHTHHYWHDGYELEMRACPAAWR